MANMLSTGVTGLMAFQTALDTTSHNISNSATPGYSRQTVGLSAGLPQYSGTGGWVGSGVKVETVTRSYNDLIAGQVRASSSGKNQWDIYSSFADQINNLFGDSSTGLSVTLQDFFDSFQSVANSPSSSSERQVLISQAQMLVGQLQAYDTRLNELDAQVSSQLRDEAQTITGLAANIAQMNAQITMALGNGGNPPNDMLDQRDGFIDELAKHVNVSTVRQGDGSLSVFIGNGQPLVVGSTSSELVTVTDQYDVSKKGLAVQSSTGTVEITDALSGGNVGGLLEFRSELLGSAKNTLGQVAVTISGLINAQQNAGMDLYGSLGADLFTIGGVDVMEHGANTGAAAVSVSRSDIGGLTDRNYILRNTSTGWMLQDEATGANVSLSGTGTALDPFTADGLSITISGSR